MTLYTFTRLVHILVAILGLGGITAAALLARLSTPAALRPPIRLASAAILLMLVSGLVLDRLSAGVFHSAAWFRIAFVTTIVAGVTLGYTRRLLAQATANKLDAGVAVRRTAGAMWLACALVTVIVIMMVGRPFA